MSFGFVGEPGLKSHRAPTPMFQADFDRLSGCLFHLGNAGLPREGSPFFAYELLSVASRDVEPSTFLEFAPEHVESAHRFLEWLLRTSPVNRLLFTSDWQFCTQQPRRFRPLTLDAFWKLHDSRTLLLNAAYPIIAPPARS
jgi:hypothetical protein